MKIIENFTTKISIKFSATPISVHSVICKKNCEIYWKFYGKFSGKNFQ